MSRVGERLKEERTRLGLSQAALANAGGVNKRAVLNYESDDNWPGGAFLAGAQRAGIDVIYVLTGERNASLQSDELTLFTAWRGTNDQVRQMVMAMLGGIGLPASMPAPAQKTGGTIKARKIGQDNSGPVSQTNTKIRMAGTKAKKSRG